MKSQKSVFRLFKSRFLQKNQLSTNNTFNCLLQFLIHCFNRITFLEKKKNLHFREGSFVDCSDHYFMYELACLYLQFGFGLVTSFHCRKQYQTPLPIFLLRRKTSCSQPTYFVPQLQFNQQLDMLFHSSCMYVVFGVAMFRRSSR